MITFILTQWKLILIGLLFAVIGVQEVRIGHAHESLSEERQARALETAQRAEMAQKAEADARRVESERQTQVTEALNAAKTREAGLRADLGRAADERGRLLDAIKRATRGSVLPGKSADAGPEPANPVADVLGACSAEVQELAGAADGHASDVKTLSDAWPK